MVNKTKNLSKTARDVRVKVDGKNVSLADLALTAYTLSCSHMGRDYAIQKGDLMFCPKCSTTKRVAKVVA